MNRSGWRHINERLIDRIVNGDAQIVADDDGRDYEAMWEARHDPDVGIERMEDAYEARLDRGWE